MDVSPNPAQEAPVTLPAMSAYRSLYYIISMVYMIVNDNSSCNYDNIMIMIMIL